MALAQNPNPRLQDLFELKRPAFVAIYDTYADAQRAVDYLADAHFPVQNLAIVGTDLRSVERVTGELSWGRVLLSGATNGLTWGLMLGAFFYLLDQATLSSALLTGVAIGIIAGLISSAISYALSRGQKDFASMTQVIATHYEILGEADVAPQARNLLSGGRAVPVRDPQAVGQATAVGPDAPSNPVPPSEGWAAPIATDQRLEPTLTEAPAATVARPDETTPPPAEEPTAQGPEGDEEAEAEHDGRPDFR